MPPAWIGLTLAFGSALATNTAYSFEHDAAAALPPLSPRRPFRSAQLLLRDRRWLTAFAVETAGWLMYVAALRLAPLALVQSVAASGVAVLAFATVRGHLSRLAWRERLAVVLALAGLTLLALSLAGTTASDQRPEVIGVVIWLAACGGAAALLIVIPTRFGRAASLGLAAGLLFADGDMSAKLVGYGGLWLVALATLIVAYGIGTSVLQSAYQRGDALTAAGTATMVTNAVPIAAGFVLFGETLPHGARAVLQIAAFACLVASAVMLGHRQVPRAGDPTPRRVLSRSLLPSVGSADHGRVSRRSAWSVSISSCVGMSVAGGRIIARRRRVPAGEDFGRGEGQQAAAAEQAEGTPAAARRAERITSGAEDGRSAGDTPGSLAERHGRLLDRGGSTRALRR